MPAGVAPSKQVVLCFGPAEAPLSNEVYCCCARVALVCEQVAHPDFIPGLSQAIDVKGSLMMLGEVKLSLRTQHLQKGNDAQ